MSGGTHVVEPADQFWPRVGVHQTREVDVVPLLDHLQLQRLAQLDRDPGRVCTHQRVTAVQESRKRRSTKFSNSWRRTLLLGPSPVRKRLLALSKLRIY